MRSTLALALLLGVLVQASGRKLLQDELANLDVASEDEVLAEPVPQDVPDEGHADQSLADALENLEQSAMDDAQDELDWTAIYSNHIEPAFNMMEKHLYPQLGRADAHVENMGRTATKMFYDAHERVSQHLGKLTGHDADLVPDWLKTSAYALLLLPLVVWILLLVYFVTQMAKAGFVYTLAKCGNLFWTIYCLFLAIMTFVISDEPLFFFHQNHPSEYVAFQFVKAALFMIHLLVLLFQVMSEVSFLNVVQWVGSTLIGVHYYLNAWHPAMIEEPPLLGFKYYAFYMYCFFIFFILPSQTAMVKARSE